FKNLYAALQAARTIVIHTNNITPRTIPEDRLSPVDLSSLPPSPMSDMPLSRDDKDFIPMGFNLMHDLDDFLGWKERHVPTIPVDSASDLLTIYDRQWAEYTDIT
ncbi:hypothetical protein IFR05_017555, partial [Cadophora sp. M221]